MRYGEIITDAFYGIKLIPQDKDLVDGFFLGASHHRFRAFNAQDERTKLFHAQLYWSHVRALCRVIAGGDFEHIFLHPSVTKGGHHRPKGWMRVFTVDPGAVSDPRDHDHLLPHDEMFSDMFADLRHGPGEAYPYDLLLKDPRISPRQISLNNRTA